ncbi:hypothetical protein JTE90_025130 [Oedothorax gibbosus]|uniref:Ig-like domain-containing protein n=1 Tax=Oedothorax gibbosus TaxID=931172 RepID=A0AAV6UGG5_9ARAC|nr:hypothetical protein JTE90_025130 [Oedothorax gibbosus]
MKLETLKRHDMQACNALSKIQTRGIPLIAQRPPRITEHPSDVLVRKHEPATLNCKAEGRPTPVVRWFKGGTPVHDTPNRMLLPSGSLFFLHVMHAKDTGTYWCQATNDAGTARSRNATLEVAALREEFRLVPKPVQAAMGETAVLECVPPRGHPDPVVRWRKDGEWVGANGGKGGRFRIVGPGSLQVGDVRQSDEGQYRCVAENLAGVRESPPAAMTVHVKPFFVREPEHVTVLSDESVQFECRVGGDPLPTITWRRQDGKMPVGRAQIQEDKSLLIKDVSSSDEGMYICEAENPVGIISASVTLTVHSRRSSQYVWGPCRVLSEGITYKSSNVPHSGSPPFPCSRLLSTLDNVRYERNAKSTVPQTQPLRCSGQYETVLMFPERSYGRFSVSREGMLVISGVTKEDKGYYICSVLSGVGSTMAKAYLEVTGKNATSGIELEGILE